jgi:hypothetical protein
LRFRFGFVTSCEHFEVVGDEVELEARAVQGWEVFEGHTPHRPHVDAVQASLPEVPGHDEPYSLMWGIRGWMPELYRSARLGYRAER